MPFNWIPIVAMLKLILAITIVAVMAQMAILAILAMAIGFNNMAILCIQLKSIKKARSVVFDSYQSTLQFKHYLFFLFFSFSRFFLYVNMPNL